MKRWLLLSATVLALSCSTATDPDLEQLQLFLRGTVRSAVDSTRIPGAAIETWWIFPPEFSSSRTADAQGNYEVSEQMIRYHCEGRLFRVKASGFASRDIRADGRSSLAFVCQNGIQQIDVYLQPSP